jgi:predicted acyltransferase
VTTSSGRLESLDVFRGLTIAAMILVSTPGTWESVYTPLDHAAWNGWTPTDLVFPFLLFAMGAAVPVALSRHRGVPQAVSLVVVRRALLLFGLGLLLNAIEAKPPLVWATFPILGVLQRIAIVYVVVAWLTERTSTRTQVVVAAVSLIAYWAAMTLIPVPGVGRMLTPNRNLAGYIDRLVLGRHLSHGTWDSEGLLSTIPAIATALCGVFAGNWLMNPGWRRLGGRVHSVSLVLWVAGVAAMAAGLLWNRVFPINKNLWTSSFVLFTAGLAAQLLAIAHSVLDVHRWRRWSLPFIAFGRNPLAAYFFSVATDRVLTRWTISRPSVSVSLKWVLYWNIFGSWAVRCCGAEAASLFYAIAYVALWAIVVIVMHRRRVYLRV